MLVRKLKPWVSSFSAAISKNSEHGDLVTIGGQITAIYDTSNLCKELEPHYQPWTMVVIDDAVGQIGVIMPPGAFESCNQHHELKEGMVILAEGKVDKIKGAEQHNDDVDVRVICWKVYPIPQPQREDNR